MGCIQALSFFLDVALEEPMSLPERNTDGRQRGAGTPVLDGLSQAGGERKELFPVPARPTRVRAGYRLQSRSARICCCLSAPRWPPRCRACARNRHEERASVDLYRASAVCDGLVVLDQHELVGQRLGLNGGSSPRE